MVSKDGKKVLKLNRNGKIKATKGSFSSTTDWQIFKSLIILSIGDDVGQREFS